MAPCYPLSLLPSSCIVCVCVYLLPRNQKGKEKKLSRLSPSYVTLSGSAQPSKCLLRQRKKSQRRIEPPPWKYPLREYTASLQCSLTCYVYRKGIGAGGIDVCLLKAMESPDERKGIAFLFSSSASPTPNKNKKQIKSNKNVVFFSGNTITPRPLIKHVRHGSSKHTSVRPSLLLGTQKKKPLIKRPFNDDDDTAALWQSLPR